MWGASPTSKASEVGKIYPFIIIINNYDINVNANINNININVFPGRMNFFGK